jgi:hypothetical protein
MGRLGLGEAPVHSSRRGAEICRLASDEDGEDSREGTMAPYTSRREPP